jgi:DNA-binding NtrC family response regulator
MTPHTSAALGPSFSESSTPAPAPAAASAPHGAESLDGDWPTLDELSLRYLHRVIEHAKGNKTKAAEMLGIDRRTVSRILTKVSKQGKTPTMQTANRK